MSKKKSQDRRIPLRVWRICSVHGAWVVGSAALPLKNGEVPEIDDVDVMVPWTTWAAASILIPDSAKVNAFGGWKWTEPDGTVIDMWPDTLDRLASRPQFHCAWHPQTGRRIFSEERSKL